MMIPGYDYLPTYHHLATPQYIFGGGKFQY